MKNAMALKVHWLKALDYIVEVEKWKVFEGGSKRRWAITIGSKLADTATVPVN